MGRSPQLDAFLRFYRDNLFLRYRGIWLLRSVTAAAATYLDLRLATWLDEQTQMPELINVLVAVFGLVLGFAALVFLFGAVTGPLVRPHADAGLEDDITDADDAARAIRGSTASVSAGGSQILSILNAGKTDPEPGGMFVGVTLVAAFGLGLFALANIPAMSSWLHELPPAPWGLYALVPFMLAVPLMIWSGWRLLRR